MTSPNPPLAHCFDALTPPRTAPPQCTACLGYIGGPRLTGHDAWTLDEWLRFVTLRQFPCYVADMGADPIGQAAEAVALMRARGWSPGRALVYDTETQVDPVWWARIELRTAELGQRAVDYGSIGFVVRNRADRIWSAHFDQIPDLDPGQNIEATQYAADVPWEGTQVDLSVMTWELWRQGGIGPRT